MLVASNLALNRLESILRKTHNALMDPVYSSFCVAYHDRFVQYQRSNAHRANNYDLLTGRYHV